MTETKKISCIDCGEPLQPTKQQNNLKRCKSCAKIRAANNRKIWAKETSCPCGKPSIGWKDGGPCCKECWSIEDYFRSREEKRKLAEFEDGLAWSNIAPRGKEQQ